MKTIKPLIAILLSTLLFSVPADAKIYNWVDEKGTLHFSEQPPPGGETSKNVESMLTYDSRDRPAPYVKCEMQKKTNEAKPGTEKKVKKSRPARAHKVELYTAKWCRYCKKARAFFRSRKIAFTEYDIDKDKAASRRMKKKYKARGVPFAVINGHRIQGFSKTAYKKALRKRR